MDLQTARSRFADARSGQLVTIGHSGPHIVPIVFAVIGDTIATAIDHKPKSTKHLQRLANIAGDPRVAVLVDHYEEDWAELWWIRADGRAAAVPAAAATGAIDALVAKYPQYRDHRPDGQVILIEVRRWQSWRAVEHQVE